MINEAALKGYLSKKFRASHISIRKIGSGVQGTGFLVELGTERGVSSFVVKSLSSQGFSHDYPSDRAAVFLLDLDEFSALPNHVKAIDVLAEMEDGSVKSIGGGKEYYLLMERGEGRDYFHDLSEFSRRDTLTGRDRERIHAMASYLAAIHTTKKDSRTLYWRKLRDTVGHGECLMGVFDMYPEGTLSYEEMAQVIKKSVDWVYTLKPRFARLSQIHGDFHPGNIWFREVKGNETGDRNTKIMNDTALTSEPRTESEFILLDRSRGPWGEPADDVTALTINYIFSSVKHFGAVRGPYLEGLRLFFDDYERLSGDREICSVVQPFYAFRGAVVANPAFYPEVSRDQRNMLFGFINNVLKTERFEPERASEYLG